MIDTHQTVYVRKFKKYKGKNPHKNTFVCTYFNKPFKNIVKLTSQ